MRPKLDWRHSLDHQPSIARQVVVHARHIDVAELQPVTTADQALRQHQVGDVQCCYETVELRCRDAGDRVLGKNGPFGEVHRPGALLSYKLVQSSCYFHGSSSAPNAIGSSAAT